VKVLKASAVDSDGDAVDLGAEEDFRKECAILVQLHHPNLLAFHGYGSTASGTAFIVTELLAGSLRGALQDDTVTLSWSTRCSIALSLARGMAYLHSIPIVHRVSHASCLQ
jgi:serine/threonine protein kinase